MTQNHPNPTSNAPSTGERSTQPESRKPSLDEIITKARPRAVQKPRGTKPSDDHISRTDKDHPVSINSPAPER